MKNSRKIFVVANGGLDDGYDVVSVSPQCGSVVVFSQNIIHESTPMVHPMSGVKRTRKVRSDGFYFGKSGFPYRGLMWIFVDFVIFM